MCPSAEICLKCADGSTMIFEEGASDDEDMKMMQVKMLIDYIMKQSQKNMNKNGGYMLDDMSKEGMGMSMSMESEMLMDLGKNISGLFYQIDMLDKPLKGLSYHKQVEYVNHLLKQLSSSSCMICPDSCDRCFAYDEELNCY
mmetsp:Transcript_34294/g.25374  ORF Transcript_34294/g.25374 Transcript_34294/m.25374 type:complete len:142 (-) Transcript_34294:2225-2650(-)